MYDKELTGLLLSLGDGVEVVSPEILRKEIMAYIDNMKYVYEKEDALF